MTLTHIDHLDDDPMLGWTHETIKEYIIGKPLQAGDQMVIAEWQGGVPVYRMMTVDSVNVGRQKRVIVAGESFHRSGKYCFEPTGRTCLLPPTPSLSPYLKASGDILQIRKRNYGI